MTHHPLVSPNEGCAVDIWPETSDADLDERLDRLVVAHSALQSLSHRGAVLDTVEEAVQRHRGPIARRIVAEVAKTPAEAEAEVDYALSFVRRARRLIDGHDFSLRIDPTRLVRKVGYGPALLITPFNDPVAGILRKVAPAIAAGSPVLVKPSPAAASTALLLGAALDEAGLAECISVAAVSAGGRVERLIEDDRIGIVSFTGSTPVGLGVASRAGRAAKPVITELGGNNPFLILADADLDCAVADLLSRKLKAAGQACSSVNRIFVHRSVLNAVMDRLVEQARALSLDRSDRPGVDLGPVISRASAERLIGLAESVRHSGGRLLTPMPLVPAEGAPFLVPLTLLETEGPTALDRQEAFGPVMSITAFDREADIFAAASRELHALAIYVYTADPERIAIALERLRFGSIGVNTTAIQSPCAPTGGFRRAGVGREGGPWGLDAFLTTINIVTRDLS